MRVLVTGGGGFLGQYVVRELLAKGHEVSGFQRSPSPDLEELGVPVIRGSLDNAESLEPALQGCEAVIHIAAKAGVWGSREEFMRTNFHGTASLLNGMQRRGIRKLVYCSSPSVVFDGQGSEGDDESIPYGSKWLFSYPESKALAEQRVLEWGRAGHGQVIALRPHLIWGIGDPHLFPSIIERAARGRLRIIGTGTNRVDHTRVENAAVAHVLALEALDRASAVNRAYFISQGDAPVLWDWVNRMLNKVGVDPVKKRVPYPLAYAMGGLCECLWSVTGSGKVPPMTRFVAYAMAKPHWFSIEAARHELGYAPEEYPTEEGMLSYARAWKDDRTPKVGR